MANDSKTPIRDVITSGTGQIIYNVPEALTGLAGLMQLIPELGVRSVDALTSSSYTMKDAFNDSLKNNLGFSTQQKLDDYLEEKGIRKKTEDLNDVERDARFVGSFAPLFGLNYINKGQKIINAAKEGSQLNRFKNAKTLSNNLAEEGIYGLYPIKTTKFNNYDKFSYLLPGVQVRSDIPLLNQKASIGIQSGINYLSEPSSPFWKEENNENNSQNNQLILTKDFRKNPNDENNQIVFNLDEIKKQKEQENNTLMYAGGVAAALLGASAFYRNYLRFLNKEVTKTFTDNPDNISALSRKMNFGEQLNTSVPDRFGFRHTLVNEGMLSEELANDLAIDDSTKVNSMFETGNFGDAYKNKFTPQSIYNELNSLKINKPDELANLDKHMNYISKVQDDTFRYNTYIMNGKTNLSPYDYIDGVFNGRISVPNKSYLTKEELISPPKIEYSAYTSELFDKIRKINKQVLNYQYKNNFISEKQYRDLIRNRFNYENPMDALFFSGYKHIAKEETDPIYKQLMKYAVNETPYNPNALPNMNVRGPHGIDPDNSKSIADVFEYQIKSALMDVEKNNQKRNTIQYMVEQQNKKIDNLLNIIDDNLDYVKRSIEDKKNSKDYDKIKKGYDNLIKDYGKQIKDMFYVKHIGSKNISTSPHTSIEPNKLFDLLNTKYDPNSDLHKLLSNYDEGFGALDKYEGMSKVANDIVSFVDGDIIHYYKVDPIIAAAFNYNPTLPSKMAELMKGMKNIVQSTITGQMNPTFALPSATMSLYEALTMFPTIAARLNLLEPASRLQYMKQIGQSMREIVTTEHAKNIVNLYDREIIRFNSTSDSPFWNILRRNNIVKLRKQIKDALSTQIHDLGGGSLKPTTKNNGKFFTLNNNTKINDKLKKFVVDHYGLDAGVQVIKTLNYLQLALREGPQLALTEYFGKAKGAIRNGYIVDEKAMKEVIAVISEYTANIGKAGSGKGFLGGLSQAISNYVPYGNIMIQSLAPKVRASGLNRGISNFYKLCMNLYDPKVRYVDILTQMKLHGKELVENKFIQGLLVTSFIPTLISYIWNYGSTENMESYHRMSDYDKSSKLILSNFFGKNNHLMIPKDQEVAVCDSIIYAMLDNLFGMSSYNKIDPAFDNSRLMMQSVARSIGIDSIPALDLLANLSGKEINLNMFDDRFGINDLSRNNLNINLSETAYKNGLVNQETTSMISSLFGIVGSSLLTVGEEANVGARNNTGLNDAKQAFIDRFTKSGKLFGPKQISSFNETSKYVYNQRNLINKIASVEVKTPQQQQVYEFIKIYNKNRIKPIHDNITELRKDIQNVKSTGRTKNGKILDYNGRKATINNINKNLQELFAKEYHEFQNMDKLLQERFGNGITLNTFMEKLQ